MPHRRRATLRLPLWAWLVLSTLAAVLADWLMLALLPPLQLSFGPVGPGVLMLAVTRLAILAVGLPALWLAHSARARRFITGLQAALQLAILALAFDGLYVEPFRLGVTELPVAAPPFLAGRPLRILQISDLHVEYLTRRDQEVLDRLDELQPDLVVLTGDYVNPSYRSDPRTLQQTHLFLAQLHAPYGVYAVNGTVDSPEIMAYLFDGLDGIRVLDDAAAVLPFPGGTLALVGVTDTHSRQSDEQALQSLMGEIPADSFTLLLYHTPDLIESASAAGVDLYLAGHTHGGQIRLPFYGAVITFSAYGKQYEMGPYRVGPTVLYVSRGVGMEGWWVPRVRFLCPPELVLVELGQQLR